MGIDFFRWAEKDGKYKKTDYFLKKPLC
jgi:hypothetical protein